MVRYEIQVYNPKMELIKKIECENIRQVQIFVDRDMLTNLYRESYDTILIQRKGEKIDTFA